TWPSSSTLARRTAAAEPNRSNSEAVSRGPMPATRCKASKSRTSAATDGVSRSSATFKLRKHIYRQAQIPNLLREFLDRGKADVGYLLLADPQKRGRVAIGPALDQQQLQHFDAQMVAALL